MTFKAGASQTCITPPPGVELAGFVMRDQPALGVLDDLYARALFLSNGSESLLWTHCDLFGFDVGWAEALKRRMAADLGLTPRQIILSATHTHSGPATFQLRQAGKPDQRYLKRLQNFIGLAAARAITTQRPVEIRFGNCDLDLGVDIRKNTKLQHTDKSFPVLSFWSRRQCVAVLSNYGMHQTCLNHENRLVSADAAGRACALAQSDLPGHPVVLITAGAGANVHPKKSLPTPEAADEIGAAIAAAIIRLASKGHVWRGRPTLRVCEGVVHLPLRRMSESEIMTEYRKTFSPRKRLSPGERRVQLAMTEWKDAAVAKADNRRAHQEVRVPLQVARVGPVRYAAVAAEVFSKMPGDLRQARQDRNVHVIGCANGVVGYLSPPESYQEQGCEIDSAYKYYGEFGIAPVGYEIVRDHLLAMLDRIG